MKTDLRVVGASLLVVSTLALALHGDPTLDDQLEWQHEQLQDRLLEREVQIDPAELLELMHDNLVRLRLVDVRDEADFNLFHLADSVHLSCEDLAGGWGDNLPEDVIVVLVGNDEVRAEAGWRMLTARGIANVYLLADGLNGWLALLRDASVRPRTSFVTAASTLTTEPRACAQDEPFLWMLPAALGDRHAASLPPANSLDGRDYEKRVQRLSKVAKPSGGCG